MNVVLFSPSQVGDLLGCSRSYVYTLMDEGALPFRRLGKLRKCSRADLEQFINGLPV